MTQQHPPNKNTPRELQSVFLEIGSEGVASKRVTRQRGDKCAERDFVKHCKFPATHPEFPRAKGEASIARSVERWPWLMPTAVSVWVRDWTVNLYPGASSVKKNIRGIPAPYHRRLQFADA